jgi:hypothetical protein
MPFCVLLLGGDSDRPCVVVPAKPLQKIRKINSSCSSSDGFISSLRFLEHQIHAMDFLEYAYLQIGENSKAKAIVDQLATILQEDVDPSLDGYLDGMRAHLPAMYALERHEWKGVLALQPLADAESSNQAITYWARAIAAGHLRDTAAARAAVQQYDAMVDAVRKSSRSYKADYMSTNRDEAHAWLAFAEGTNDEALSLLRSVADKQDAEGKGEVELPAREMLGDVHPRNEPPQGGLARMREIHGDRRQSFQRSLRRRSLRRIAPTATDRRSPLRTTSTTVRPRRPSGRNCHTPKNSALRNSRALSTDSL